MEHITFKKKILLISHSSQIGGAELCLFSLVKSLRFEYNITVLLPSKGPLYYELNKENINTKTLPYVFWFGSKSETLKRIIRIYLNIISTIALIKLIKRIKPDLVFTNSLATPIGALASKFLGLPHIWHAHEIVQKGLGRRYTIGEKSSLHIIKRTTKKIICNSISVMKSLKYELGNYNDFIVAYNGFDFLKAADPKPSLKHNSCIQNTNEIKLVIIGSISPNKGHIDAIRALFHLTSRGFRIKLIIVGSGTKAYVRKLKTTIDQYSLGNNVVFTGFKRNIEQVYNNAAITLICSQCEAFGRTAVESLSFQTPVIGTRCGGLQEIIQHDVNGLLYQHGNHQELAECIAKLITDKALYCRLVQNSKESIINRFSLDTYISIVKSCISSTLIDTSKS